MRLRNLQIAPRDLARVGLGSGPGLGLSLMLGLGSGLSQKFVTGACAITKLRNAFCKLGKLTNRAQHRTLKCKGSSEIVAELCLLV